MGLFNSGYEKESEELWKDVKDDLRPKDGFKHVLMLDSNFTHSGLLNNKAKYSMKYTTIINNIIEKMQEYGYEIENIEMTQNRYSIIRILIIYK